VLAVNEHTGFHEYKDGKRFNPDCPACLEEELIKALRTREGRLCVYKWRLKKLRERIDE